VSLDFRLRPVLQSGFAHEMMYRSRKGRTGRG
jgi:hypothetical protein